MSRLAFTRDPAKLTEHRLRERGYSDGYARMPAASALRTYQVSYRRGAAARDAAEKGETA